MAAQTRVLIAIASYGVTGDRYLSRIVGEYQSMSFDVDIVVLTNAHKEVPSGVELVVGLPIKNPWSLPYGHKQIFANRLYQYDVFIYSEDDILITENNVRAFLWAADILGDGEIPGFFLKEIGPDGTSNYPQAHGPFHWDVQSVKSVAGHTFAFFTNEHAACYALTRKQLQRAIESGGFLVGPHEGRYDMLCSAATDPYTQCGFKKLICVSRFSDFVLHHLPNKYVGRFGVSEADIGKQIEALIRGEKNGGKSASLFEAQTKLMGSRFSKDYYEPIREDAVSLLSAKSQNILSFGSGRGATEEWLANHGRRVVAVPMDSVISAGLETQGVKVVKGDLKTVRETLTGENFDCLLMLGVLHLVQDPVAVLRSFVDILSMDSQVIVMVPNLSKLSAVLGRMRHDKRYSGLGSYEKTGVHVTSKGIVSGWIATAGLRFETCVQVAPRSVGVARRAMFSLAASLFASEFIVTARKC